MAGTIKHRFVSARADGTDATKVRKTEWNDSLVIAGGATGQLFFRDTGAADGWDLASNLKWDKATNTLILGSAASLAWDNGAGVNDVILVRGATNVLAQRNGTTAQGFQVYNTYTNSTNYERFAIDWITTANVLRLATEAAGAGTVRNIASLVPRRTVDELVASRAVASLVPRRTVTVL